MGELNIEKTSEVLILSTNIRRVTHCHLSDNKILENAHKYLIQRVKCPVFSFKNCRHNIY